MVFFLLVEITLIAEGGVQGVRGPADIYIETHGLHGSCAKLLALGFFVFVERGGRCRSADLDDFWKEEAGLRRRRRSLDGFAASPET
jgi:hypothetical protein